jgi:hypothetical protein
MTLGPEAAGGASPVALPELGGALALDLPARIEADAEGGGIGGLYAEAPWPAQTAIRRFIPYHLWGNRAPGEMLVWVRR